MEALLNSLIHSSDSLLSEVAKRDSFWEFLDRQLIPSLHYLFVSQIQL